MLNLKKRRLGQQGSKKLPEGVYDSVVIDVRWADGYALEEAWMAPGDQTIVSVQQKMGQSPCLCVTGSDQAEIRELGSVSAVLAVRGDGILYLDGDGMLWRYFLRGWRYILTLGAGCLLRLGVARSDWW